VACSAVYVAARVHVEGGHQRLLWAHVSRRAEELLERGEEGLIGEPSLRGLRDAEVNDYGHPRRARIVDRDEDVRRFEVPVDDAFLVGVLNGLAGLDEQVEPLARGKPVLIAEVGDLDPPNQLHDKIGPAGLCRPSIQDLGDVRMIHHCQRLALGFEPRNDALGVHPELDYLQGHAAAHRFLLFRHIDYTAAAFADLL
jgi:hypothetical protein